MQFIDLAATRGVSIQDERPVIAGRVSPVAVTCSDAPTSPVSHIAGHSAPLTGTALVSAFLNPNPPLRSDLEDRSKPQSFALDFSANGSDAVVGACPCGWQIPTVPI